MNNKLISLAGRLPKPLTAALVNIFLNFKLKRHAKIKVTGLENLNCAHKRPFLFVCNHLSNSDAIILNKVLKSEDLTFVAGIKLEGNSFTSLGLTVVKTIPIHPNSPDRTAIKKVIATIKEGKNVLVFPEGTRSRTAQMIEGKKGVLLFALQTGASIVPVGIWGTEKFLPVSEDMGDEQFRDAEVNVSVGKAFTLPERTAGGDKKEWEEDAMKLIMGSVAGLLPEGYRGVYA